MCDAIDIAADDGVEKSVVVPIKIGVVTLEIIETQEDVSHFSLTIGSLQRDDNPAVGRDPSFISAIAQGVNLDGSSVRQLSKWLAGHFRLRLNVHRKHS